jgi:hypothetical protein
MAQPQGAYPGLEQSMVIHPSQKTKPTKLKLNVQTILDALQPLADTNGCTLTQHTNTRYVTRLSFLDLHRNRTWMRQLGRACT